MERRKDFAGYRDELARELAHFRIGDAPALSSPTPPATASPDERLVQCIWFDAMFVHGDLATTDGRPLEVLETGRWNREGGPDFRDARIRIDEQVLSGDVEIHLNDSGWRQHGHHRDPAYDSVVLHAFLRRDGEKPRQASNTRGELIPAFEMEPVLFPDLEVIRQTIRLEDYPYDSPSAVGRCQPLMSSLDETFVSGMLDAAGRERLEAKASRYADQAVGSTLSQVFYQALMTAMGHKANKGLFFLLSKRAPLHEMADYLADVGPERAVPFFQAILFHVAGLAPDAEETSDSETSDPAAEKRRFLTELRDVWSQFGPYYDDRIIPPTKRWNTGVRPVNFAHRRIGGVAHLLARLFLSEPVTKLFARRIAAFDPQASPRDRRRWIKSDLIAAFVVDVPVDFWARRFHFHSRVSKRPMKLIGENRAASIVLNALLPLMLLHARTERNFALEDNVHRIYEQFPALESNSIVRHMRKRLFNDDERAKRLLKTESRQQALFHIFNACCNRNEKGCGDCYFATRYEGKG